MPPDQHLWYYLRSGLVQEVTEGPFDEVQLAELARSGEIKLKTKLKSATRTKGQLIYAEDIPNLAVIISQAALEIDRRSKEEKAERAKIKQEAALLKQRERAALAEAKANQSERPLAATPDDRSSVRDTPVRNDYAAAPHIMTKSATSAETTVYDESPSMFRNQPLLFVAGCLLCFVLIGIPIMFFWWFTCKGTRLTITTKRVTLRKGIFSKHISEIRHADINHFQIHQSFFQRIFGVGTVAISSAGQAGIEIHVAGMPRPGDIRSQINSFRD